MGPGDLSLFFEEMGHILRNFFICVENRGVKLSNDTEKLHKMGPISSEKELNRQCPY